MCELTKMSAVVPGHDGKAGCAAISVAAGSVVDQNFLRDLLQYCLQHLPRYAVPVFIRHQTNLKPMHNQKQNKVPLRSDGLDLDKIYGVGRDFQEAREAGQDVIYWWPGGLGSPTISRNHESYVPFSRDDWLKLMSPQSQDRARL